MLEVREEGVRLAFLTTGLFFVAVKVLIPGVTQWRELVGVLCLTWGAIAANKFWDQD